MAGLLSEMNNAAHAARNQGKRRLPRRVLAAVLTRHDELAAAGVAANPQPKGRKRDALEAAATTLPPS